MSHTSKYPVHKEISSPHSTCAILISGWDAVLGESLLNAGLNAASEKLKSTVAVLAPGTTNKNETTQIK